MNFGMVALVAFFQLLLMACGAYAIHRGAYGWAIAFALLMIMFAIVAGGELVGQHG